MEAQRRFRCDACGHVDNYRLPRFTLVRPVCCGQPMRAGPATVSDTRAALEVDLVEDKRQPWRMEPEDAARRRRILVNHPEWQDLRQVWQTRGGGRLWGSEFVGMVGRIGETWHFDSGHGIPEAKRLGTGRNARDAAGNMVRALQ